jgi:hypothetical protein
MFEHIRASLNALLDSARSPGDRRAVLADMKETLVRARLGVEDMKKGVEEARARAAAARTELETIRRRRDLAAGIGDRETVEVAERFEKLQAERVAVLEQKAETQQRELALLEAEVAEMGAEFRRAAAGAPAAGPASGPASGPARAVRDPGAASDLAADAAERAAAREVEDLLDPNADLSADIRRVSREQERQAREQSADERLAELKRRMGK